GRRGPGAGGRTCGKGAAWRSGMIARSAGAPRATMASGGTRRVPMTDESGLDWLYGLQKLGMKLGLENTRALCTLLGGPERAFASVIVGGTNGKGSVAAMLEAILRRAGIRTGLYSSPHLVRPNERIRIDGSDATDADWDAALRTVRGRIESGLGGALERHPTFFEAMTAMAFDAFRRAGVEWAVLEVGLGGRFDSTNVVEPALSIVTSVDLDHQ